MLSKILVASALSSGALLVPAHAQTPVAPQNAPRQSVKSGYELLAEAGAKILPDYSVYEKMPAAEKLQKQRLIVARNAPALQLLREALQKPIAVPLSTNIAEIPALRVGARVRELARQLDLESDVRFADGDFAGAINSKLDSVELGIAFENGPVLASLVGIAMEAIGRRNIEKSAARLNPEQLHAAATRLVALEARRPAFAAVLQRELLEKQSYYPAMLAATLKTVRGNPAAPQDDTFSAADYLVLEKLSPQTLTSNLARAYSPRIANARLPFASASDSAIPADLDPLSRLSILALPVREQRFPLERSVAQNRLLIAALELRALKLESGSYPTQFNAPLDPFSPDAKPLVYKKTATGFLLYSVGPDGKDDSAGEIQTVETGEDTGAKTVTARLAPNSTGDIVQNPF